MLLLMADNVDKCFERYWSSCVHITRGLFIFFQNSCPPRSFIPALCRIFMDVTVPDNVLEVTARALTYYLDVSVDCTRKIASVDGALKAIVRRLDNVDMTSKTSKDITEQCVKVCTCIVVTCVHMLNV